MNDYIPPTRSRTYSATGRHAMLAMLPPKERFHAAVTDGDVEYIQNALSDDKAKIIDSLDAVGCSPLGLAIKKGKTSKKNAYFAHICTRLSSKAVSSTGTHNLCTRVLYFLM